MQIPTERPSLFSSNITEPQDAPRNCDEVSGANESPLDIDRMIHTLTSVLDDELIERVGYVYQVNCVGLGDFYMDLKNGRGHVAEGTTPHDLKADVTFTVASEDLLALLFGTMNPLEAYMSGRLSMTGDTKAAMRLQHLGDAIRSRFQRG